MNRLVPLALCCALSAAACTQAADAPWVAALAPQVERIDADTPGAMGVYLHRLSDDSRLDHDAGRPWYLASTIKVPVAIAILQSVEAGERSLDDEIELRREDFVDGSGDLIWQEPGGRYSLRTLLAKSIENSDSVATDMLIRALGEDALNKRVASWTSGFGPITTILQVRYDAYGELHPDVSKLSNMQIVALRQAPAGEQRLAALRKALGVEQSALKGDSIEAAFERYYAGDRNTATLEAFGTVLDKLAAGELLSPEHTTLLLGHMGKITTGGKRLQAGLPKGTTFAQKTGTQLARACNVGIIEPGEPAATVVVACLEKFDDIAEAEAALQTLGGAIGGSGVLR